MNDAVIPAVIPPRSRAPITHTTMPPQTQGTSLQPVAKPEETQTPTTTTHAWTPPARETQAPQPPKNPWVESKMNDISTSTTPPRFNQVESPGDLEEPLPVKTVEEDLNPPVYPFNVVAETGYAPREERNAAFWQATVIAQAANSFDADRIIRMADDLTRAFDERLNCSPGFFLNPQDTSND